MCRALLKTQRLHVPVSNPVMDIDVVTNKSSGIDCDGLYCSDKITEWINLSRELIDIFNWV